MFTIESNVPIPANVKEVRTKYPLEQLKPGESFYVKLEDPKKNKNLRSSMAVRAKKLGITIVTYADESGVRVWRTR
jgi:TusA-related sulfurtransferase